MCAKIPVVLSTDIGNEIDDQWAVAHLLLEPRFDVLGILSAHAGNFSAHHTHRVLVEAVECRLGLHDHPPLIEGSSLPLADLGEPSPSEASEFLIESSRSFARENRLTVLVIGAATDIASAILADPSITSRTRLVQMAFESEAGGDIFNVWNDPKAEQVILNSDIPLTLGSADVCRRDLPMHYGQAQALLAGKGRAGAWLWEEFQDWYGRHIQPSGTDDRSRPHTIWDEIVTAHALGLTQECNRPRPRMRTDASFDGLGTGTVSWITGVDSAALWTQFAQLLERS